MNEKYQKIIDAAIKVFAKKGFFHAKVADVAKQADVADGTIYLYFKNKDDLLISIFENSMDNFLSQAKKTIDTKESIKDKLKAFLTLHLTLLEKNQKLATVLQLELRSSHKFMTEYKAEKFFQYLRLIEELIIEGQQQGLFKPNLNPHIVTRAIFGAVDELALEWVLMKKKSFVLEEAAEQLFQMLFEGIRL
jgi:TetR/AcrR family transcriptional regulator, fatty acid metabolism regulator protein